MTKKKTEVKEEVTPAAEELSPEQTAERNDMVGFVANNILNSITLNQAVTVVQQVALRDANTIVSEADEDKLKEISDAMEAAAKAMADQIAEQQRESEDAPPVPEPA